VTDRDRPLRVVIVDDEEPGRLALRQDLATFDDVEVLAECANGFEAVKAITETRPDLVILDVQMPKLNGFEVLELVGPGIPVIFVTAYDQFALKAFEFHAVDYLLKPFSRDRLAAAIDRVRASTALSTGASTAVSPGTSTAGLSPSALRASARRPGEPLDRIVIRDGAQVHVVPIEKVDYIEAQDDYVAVRTAGRSLLKEQTLGDIEEQLDTRRFVRIHRSYLLNIDRLARVELYAKDSRIAILTDGSKLPVSRAGYQRLKELL
jgi:two-component system LytT family response regulator